MKSEVKGSLETVLDALSRRFSEIGECENPEADLKLLAAEEIERALSRAPDARKSGGRFVKRPYGGTGRIFGDALREVLRAIWRQTE